MSWQDSFTPDASVPQALPAAWQNSFVADGNNIASTPQLPTQQNSQTNGMGLGEQAFRQLGLAGRDLMQGVAGLVQVPADMTNQLINNTTTIANNELGTHIQQLGMPTKDFSDLLTKEGLPTPQNNTEDYVNGVGQLLAGGAGVADSIIPVAKKAYANAADALGSLLAKKSYPVSSDAAKTVANQFYTQADNLGGKLTPNFTDSLIDKAASIAPQTNAGQLTTGETELNKLIERWNNGDPSKGLPPLRGQPLSLSSVQEMDEGLGNLIDKHVENGQLSKEGRPILQLQTDFRNAIQNAGPKDVEGGLQGFEALDQGRQAYSQAMKMRDIERIQAKADLSDNGSTTIKNGVKNLLTSPGRTSGYNDDELQALNDAANRGFLGGTLHLMGSRLLPLVAGLGGMAEGGAGEGALYGMLAHAGTGMMRSGADTLQSKRLGSVLDTMGKNVPQFSEIEPSSPAAPPLALPKPQINVPPGGFQGDQDISPPTSTPNVPTGIPQIGSQFYAPNSRALTYQPRPDFIGSPEGQIAATPGAQLGKYVFGEKEGLPMTAGERAAVAYARLLQNRENP